MPSLRSFSPKVNPASDFSTTKALTLRAAPAVGVGHREDGVVLGDTGVGDPRLLAVEHPVVAVGRGPGAHRRGVAAGLALGQRVGERGGALGQGAEVLLLQVLRAGEDQRRAAELVGAGDQRRGGAHPGDLLHDDGAGDGVGADAAVLLGDVRGVEVGGDERVVRRRSGSDAVRSTSAAYGAILSSATARTASRMASWSSETRNRSKSGLCVMVWPLSVGSVRSRLARVVVSRLARVVVGLVGQAGRWVVRARNAVMSGGDLGRTVEAAAGDRRPRRPRGARRAAGGR